MKVAIILVLAFVSVNASLADRPDKALLAQRSLRREAKQTTGGNVEVWREYQFQAWAKNHNTTEEIAYLYDNRTESASIYTTNYAGTNSTAFVRIPDEEVPMWALELYWNVTKHDLALPTGQWIDDGYWWGYLYDGDYLVLDKYDENWYRVGHYEFKDFQWYSQEQVEVHHLQVPDYLTDLVRDAQMGGGSGEGEYRKP